MLFFIPGFAIPLLICRVCLGVIGLIKIMGTIRWSWKKDMPVTS